MDYISSAVIQEHIDQLHREAAQFRLVALARRATKRNRRPQGAGARHSSHLGSAA